MSNDKLFAEFPPVSTKDWEEIIHADLKGADYNKKLVWKTQEGFQVKPYYRSEDLENLTYLQAEAGVKPFIRAMGSEGNQWEVRQDISHEKNPAKANALAKDVLSKGAQSVGLCAKGVESQADMDTLLEGLDLYHCGIHFTCSRNYGQCLDFFVNFLTKKGIDTKKVYGSINFDFFHFALKHGDYYHSLEENIAEAARIFKTYASVLPKFRLINVNAQYIHNAGSTLTQELGIGLAWAHEYLYLLQEKGISLETFARRWAFHMAQGSNYFMEIAKIRACRLLWSKIAEQYSPKSEEDSKVFIHASSSLWNKSLYDPYVNILRTTTETMSSAIGGADSINVTPFDSTFQNCDDFSLRMARNQQILLKEESFMDKVADPAAGSYYIENLTDSIARHAWDIFKEIEKRGGFIKAIESGFIQDMVLQSAAERDADISNRKIFVLGTNQFPNLQEKMADKIKFEKKTCACSCTDKTPLKKLCTYRATQVFEDIRLQTERYAATGKKKPSVFLFTYGNLAMRKARAGFALNFFACAAYDIVDNAGFKTVEEGVQAALASKAEILVFCSSDEEYAALLKAATPLLKDKMHLVLAGYPKEEIENFKALGIEEFIHVKSNHLEVLNKFQNLLIK